MTYQDLSWETLNTTRNHLYQRLTDPLDKAINYVDFSQDIEQVQRTQNLTEAHRQLSMLMNLTKAWEALILWKAQKPVNGFKEIGPGDFPDWLLEYLSQRAIIKLEHAQRIHVHPEAFFEGVVLLVNIAEKVGELSHIMFNDAAAPREGVWLRIVFMPKTSVTFPSKLAILDRFDKEDPVGADVAFHFGTANDLFELNKTRFSLQNNTRTGHQAFAVLLPALGASSIPATPSPAVALVTMPLMDLTPPKAETVATVAASEPAPATNHDNEATEPMPAFMVPQVSASMPIISEAAPPIEALADTVPHVAIDLKSVGSTLAQVLDQAMPQVIEPPLEENGLDTIPVSVPAPNRPETQPLSAESGSDAVPPPDKVISLAEQIRSAIAKLSTAELDPSRVTRMEPRANEPKENNQDTGATRETNSSSSSAG